MHCTRLCRRKTSEVIHKNSESEIDHSRRYRIPTSKCMVSADSETDSEISVSKGKRTHTDDVVTADIQKIKKKKMENMRKVLFPNDGSTITNITNVETSDNPPTGNSLEHCDREIYEQKIAKLERKVMRRDKKINLLELEVASMTSEVTSTKKDKEEIDQVIRLVNGVPLNKKTIEVLMKYESITKFVRNVASLVWTDDELIDISVSGKKCTNKPDALPKPALIGTVKYEAVKELFNEKLVFDNHPKACVESSRKELNRTLALMIGEKAAKKRRQAKKNGLTTISISP